MSGLDFLDELRKRKIDTEVIFISGYNRFEYAQKAVNLGAFGYLLKPVDKKGFEDMIKRCLIRCGSKDSGLKQKASEVKKDSEENRGIVKKVKEYLSEHYAEDVNLESVADRVGLHPSYLSSLFKKEESTTFLNYLTNIRIEEAKRLLREGKKVHYISRSVGYRSEQYFSSVFKKRTGQSLSLIHIFMVILEYGLAFIPEESRIAGVVRTCLAWYREGYTWKESVTELHDTYASNDSSISFYNFGVEILALLYGEGKFEETVLLAINGGYDTDCTAAAAVSYTHLDVYKRQGIICGICFLFCPHLFYSLPLSGIRLLRALCIHLPIMTECRKALIS